MKKTSFIFIVLVLAWTGLKAQAVDTLPCGERNPDYFYTHWYDTADWFLNPKKYDNPYFPGKPWSAFHFNSHVGYGSAGNVMTFEQYTPHPLRVKGVWAMLSQTSSMDPCQPPQWGVKDSARLPEYLYLYVPNPDVPLDPSHWMDTSRWLLRVATVRWDTAHPKMLCLKKTADGHHENLYCHIYEAYFDTAVTVEGEFWIGGSCNSNTMRPEQHIFDHFPTYYLCYNTDRCGSDNSTDHRHWQVGHSPDGPWGQNSSSTYKREWGPFGVITENQRHVQLFSNDSAQGLALYSAYYHDSTFQTIKATPRTGFHFSHWNDGITDNPRSIFVSSDTSFTAYFSEWPTHQVSIVSEYSNVIYYGDGFYNEGDTAEIFLQYLGADSTFSHWNDSITDNPLSFAVTQDTTFVAHFKPKRSPGSVSSPDSEPLFSLNPNPARESVTVTLSPSLSDLHGCRLTLHDAAGHELLAIPFDSRQLTIPTSGLPAGLYLFTLHSPQGSHTARLVIE